MFASLPLSQSDETIEVSETSFAKSKCKGQGSDESKHATRCVQQLNWCESLCWQHVYIVQLPKISENRLGSKDQRTLHHLLNLLNVVLWTRQSLITLLNHKDRKWNLESKDPLRVRITALTAAFKVVQGGSNRIWEGFVPGTTTIDPTVDFATAAILIDDFQELKSSWDRVWPRTASLRLPSEGLSYVAKSR